MPNKREARRALAHMQRHPWAILPDWLELLADIAAREDVRDIDALLAKRGARLDRTRDVMMRDDVAVLEISGPIFRYANMFTDISGATSLEMVSTDFREALDNPRVGAIVLAIDSPGGQTNGIQEFADMVFSARGVKPVTAYVNELGASAAYFIAAAAEHVVLAPMASVGSIGVVASVFTDKDKHEVQIVSSQSPGKRPDVLTQEGRGQIQAHIDALAQVFVESVAKYRGVDTDTVLKDYGRGGVLVGEAAVAAGMADELGSLEAVIAGLSGSNEGVVIVMKIMTAAEVAAAYPAAAEELRKEGCTAGQRDAFAAGKAEGITEGAVKERQRIEAVECQSIPGHEALINVLKFDGKTTGPEAAVQVLNAEREARKGALAGLRTDAGALKVPPSSGEPPKLTVVDSNLPLDERCKAEWDAKPDLRSEFTDLAAYVAFRKHEASGHARILGAPARA